MYVGTGSCTILLRTFTKTGIHLAMRLAEAPPMTRIRVCCVVNFTREWSVFRARMKRVNSKCSSVQLRVNSAIYSLHSRLVWTHLEAGVKASRALHTDVSRNLDTDVVRGVLPGLREEELDCCPVVQSPLFR